MLSEIAKILSLTEEEFQEIKDLAIIESIPDDIRPKKEVLEALPVFFRTARDLKPSEEQLKELIEILKKGYDYWLSPEEISQLNLLYQKRHILAHNEGIIDAKYIKNSKDISHKEGQRIVINNRDIEILLSCLEKLGDGLKKSCVST